MAVHTPLEIPGSPATSPAPAGSAPGGSSHRRLDDLEQIITAYNRVTDDLRHSHEALRAEVVRLQQQLASTDAQLQRSKRLAALGEMAAGIAHEIRNPLAAIQLYATMLDEDLRSDLQTPAARAEMSNAARQIAVAVRGLDAIVNDVLSFAREISPRRISIRVDRLLDRAIQAYQPALRAVGITVNHPLPREAAAEEPMTLMADADLLHQALGNLIRNAIDAMTPESGLARSAMDPAVLSITSRREDDRVVLVVRDTGPGIADEDVDRIFNPFFTTRNTGTGLGLAIVHRIVDAHDGAISVHNDGGAVFELSLPTQPVPQRDWHGFKLPSPTQVAVEHAAIPGPPDEP